jgi:HEAT repeat protein
MLFTLMTVAMAAEPMDLADLTQLQNGYGAALSRIVNDPNWTDVDLHVLATDNDWRVAHQARVVLAWRTDGAMAAEHWSMAPLETRAQGIYRFPGGSEAWDMVFADRLLHAQESDVTRIALVEACYRSVFDESQMFIDLLVDEPSAKVRENLVFSLVRSEVGIEAIRIGLADSDPMVRQIAARGASARNDGELIQGDLVRALQDPASEVRAGAARSLGVLRLTTTAPSLVPLLRDRDSEVRLNALRALDRLDAATPYAAGLLDDSEPKVQRLAVKITSR